MDVFRTDAKKKLEARVTLDQLPFLELSLNDTDPKRFEEVQLWFSCNPVERFLLMVVSKSWQRIAGTVERDVDKAQVRVQFVWTFRIPFFGVRTLISFLLCILFVHISVLNLSLFCRERVYRLVRYHVVRYHFDRYHFDHYRLGW